MLTILNITRTATLFIMSTLFSASAYSMELEDFPNSLGIELTEQVSPGSFIDIEEAYVSSKYVGGLWLVVTFSVPDHSINKEVYMVIDRSTGRTITGKFGETFEDISYMRANTVWLGSEHGRARFVMAFNSESRSTGRYDLYVKVGGQQYSSHFKLQ